MGGECREIRAFEYSEIPERAGKVDAWLTIV